MGDRLVFNDDVACPTCGNGPGVPCKVPRYPHGFKSHAARVDAAQRAMDAPSGLTRTTTQEEA